MKKLHLSPRNIFQFLLMTAVLTTAILACGIGAGAPAPIESAPAEPAETEPPSIINLTPFPIQPASVTAIPAIPERRRLTLEFPARIRVGDSDRVRLTLEVDELGNITPTAEVGGNEVTGETIEIPNLYETHHVIAEARFDIAGMQVSPPDLSSQTLERGQSVTFYWSVRPEEVGVYRGTVWLYLRFVDRKSGEESRKAVSAQMIEIEAVNLFGFSGNFARATGLVGSVVGTILGFPFFEDILKILLKRRKSAAT